MQQELAIIQQKYFTPESTFPGLPIDPEGGAGRAAAQGKQHRHLSAEATPVGRTSACSYETARPC